MIDYEAHRAEVARQNGITDERVYKRNISQLTASALIDIAESLSVLAAESRYAMNPAGTIFIPEEPERTGEPDPDDPETLPLYEPEVGDSVRHESGMLGVVDAVGIDQGEVWAGVDWDEDGTTTRVWAKHLVKVEEPKPTKKKKAGK